MGPSGGASGGPPSPAEGGHWSRRSHEHNHSRIQVPGWLYSDQNVPLPHLQSGLRLSLVQLDTHRASYRYPSPGLVPEGGYSVFSLNCGHSKLPASTKRVLEHAVYDII